MVVGYNHNIRYKGELFHVQTEDSGINNPHIITLLYRGGNIIASKKTSYADIVKMGNLNQVVEELMKEQHKDMLRRLKSAEFDAKLGLEVGVETDATASVPSVSMTAEAPAPPLVSAAVPAPIAVSAAAAVAAPISAPAAAAAVATPVTAPAETAVPKEDRSDKATQSESQSSLPDKDSPKKKQSLDDLIFDFLSTGDNRH